MVRREEGFSNGCLRNVSCVIPWNGVVFLTAALILSGGETTQAGKWRGAVVQEKGVLVAVVWCSGAVCS